MSGKLTVVGFGPGSKGDMTLRAVEAIENADIVTGFTTYIRILKEFFPGIPDFTSNSMVNFHCVLYFFCVTILVSASSHAKP